MPKTAGCSSAGPSGRTNEPEKRSIRNEADDIVKLNAKQIAAICGGTFVVEPIDACALASGITWDSRDVAKGDVYIAIPGARVDGHDFVQAAISSGAVCALVMEPVPEEVRVFAREMGAAIIEVANTQTAVADLARAWRSHLKGLVIGVTGSSGKTTTKNLIRDVLATTLDVVATRGNQNNELGAPRTLLSAEATTDAVVVELGIQHTGEMTFLCEFIRPDWGVVVSVGESHIEYMKTRENIARAKGELFACLPGGGMAFVNAADEFADVVCDSSRIAERNVRCSAFDGSGNALIADGYARSAASPDGSVRAWATDVSINDEGCPAFALHIAKNGMAGEETAPVSMVLRGLHNVGNACAAAAVGAAAGVPIDRIAHALAASVPESGRQEIIRARAGYRIVNDAYNANPESMRASLLTFASMACKGKRYAVLGDMGELGEYAVPSHEGIGRLVAGLPIDLVICVGELASHIARAALEAGAEADSVLSVDAISDVLGELDIRLEPDDCVLVKASHFMGLSRVVEGLRA